MRERLRQKSVPVWLSMRLAVLLGLFAHTTSLVSDNSPTTWTPPPQYALGTYNHKAMYLVDISVGSNGQTFRVLVDTGSSTLVLPADSCKDEACVNHHRFAAADSATSEPTNRTLMIGFGLGKVQGHIFKDEVCMPSGSSVPLTEVFLQANVGSCAKMAFLVANTESADFSKVPYDGILGLGLDDPNVKGNDFSFLRQLVVAGKLSSPTFALHLGNDGQSSLSLGGADESQLANGQMSWWDLSSYANGYWQFSACDITLNGVPQNFGRIEVAVDSGTSLLAADGDLKGWLQQKLRLDGQDGCTSINQMPRLGLKRHDGSSLELLPSDYVDQSDGACTLALMPKFQSVNGQRLILGDSFLRRYVVLFDRDNKRLGFGVSADDDNGPQLVEALFPSSDQPKSACEDHQLNSAFSGFVNDIVDDGGFQQAINEQSQKDHASAGVGPEEVKVARLVTTSEPEHAVSSETGSSPGSESLVATASKAQAGAAPPTSTDASSLGNDYLSYLKLVQLHSPRRSSTRMDNLMPNSRHAGSQGKVITVPLQRSIL